MKTNLINTKGKMNVVVHPIPIENKEKCNGKNKLPKPISKIDKKPI